ncbi:flagellar brake protein [Domibacillus indicus]|uniref:flagellar brake protein n=1 Tax=Domibacillus indicus TaxID=1437523 RepID=UPI0006181E11|nr:flagellar brake domain-containing protein [Domibacillus indicus]
MLEPGVTLTLEPFDGNSEKEEYRCKVVDKDEGKLFIDYPVNIQTNRTVFLLDGMQLSASFVDPTASSAVFLFRTEVIGRTKKNIPMLALQDPGRDSYVRVQRRKFVRVQKAIDIAVELDGMPAFSSITEDISAGGAAILLPGSVQAEGGTKAKLYGVIPSQQGEPRYFETMAELIRVQQDQKSGRRTGSFQFTDFAYAEQQMLMRFCFEQQLQLRKKGIG